MQGGRKEREERASTISSIGLFLCCLFFLASRTREEAKKTTLRVGPSNQSTSERWEREGRREREGEVSSRLVWLEGKEQEERREEGVGLVLSSAAFCLSERLLRKVFALRMRDGSKKPSFVLEEREGILAGEREGAGG